MKKLILTVALFISGITFSQTYNTGDKSLDGSLMSINVEAKTNLPQIKQDWAKAYNTTTTKIESFLSKGMSAGDVFMAYEIAKITKRPVDNVVKSYQVNKKKGWGAIAKEMGIKPGSAEFHALKGNAKNKATGSKKKQTGKNPVSQPSQKPGGKPTAKPSEKPVIKPGSKPTEKPAEKTNKKPVISKGKG